VSLLYRNKEWLTLGLLLPAWASELADGKTKESHFWDFFLEDITNGRFDDVGPLRNGHRMGLAYYVESEKAVPIRGEILIRKFGVSLRRISDRLLVAKEAVLDFARRHGLPPPSWWADTSSAEKEQKSARSSAQRQRSDASPRGRKPKVDWDGGIKDFIFHQLDYHGWPQTGDREWSCQAQVEAAVRKFIGDKYNIFLSESVIRHHTHRLMFEWRRRRPEK
jgi:hypothetical protein